MNGWVSLAGQEREGEIFTEHQLGTSYSLATFVIFGLGGKIIYTGEKTKAEGA